MSLSLPEDAAAIRFLSLFSCPAEGIPATIDAAYSELAPRGKLNVSKADFEMSVSKVLSVLGGPALDRKTIASRAFRKMPISDEEGTFAHLTYETKYPAASMVEEVMLERLSDSRWAVISSQMRPKVDYT